MQDMGVRSLVVVFLNPEVGVRDKPTDLLLVSAVFWCLGRAVCDSLSSFTCCVFRIPLCLFKVWPLYLRFIYS